MGIEKTTNYVCDLCGRKSHNVDFSDSNNSGHTTLRLNGSRGSRSIQGDWGGMNINEELLLCFSCTDKIVEFINSKVAENG